MHARAQPRNTASALLACALYLWARAVGDTRVSRANHFACVANLAFSALAHAAGLSACCALDGASLWAGCLYGVARLSVHWASYEWLAAVGLVRVLLSWNTELGIVGGPLSTANVWAAVARIRRQPQDPPPKRTCWGSGGNHKTPSKADVLGIRRQPPGDLAIAHGVRPKSSTGASTKECTLAPTARTHDSIP